MRKIANLLRKTYRAEVIETVALTNYNMLNLQKAACRMFHLWWIFYMIALFSIVFMLSIANMPIK